MFFFIKPVDIDLYILDSIKTIHKSNKLKKLNQSFLIIFSWKILL